MPVGQIFAIACAAAARDRPSLRHHQSTRRRRSSCRLSASALDEARARQPPATSRRGGGGTARLPGAFAAVRGGRNTPPVGLDGGRAARDRRSGGGGGGAARTVAPVGPARRVAIGVLAARAGRRRRRPEGSLPRVALQRQLPGTARPHHEPAPRDPPLHSSPLITQRHHIARGQLRTDIREAGTKQRQSVPVCRTL